MKCRRIEHTSKIPSFSDRYTTQMCAYANHDQPFRLLNTVLVWFGVSKGFPFCVLGFFDLAFSSVTDEDGLASPFHEDLVCSVSF